MIIMDTVGDLIKAEASAASALTVTLYGISTATGVDTYKKLGQGALTGAGTQDTLYTVPALTSAVVSLIVIANISATARTVNLWHVPNGGAYGDANALLKGVNVPANTTIVWNKGEITIIPPANVNSPNITGNVTVNGIIKLGDGGITNYVNITAAGVVTYLGSARPKKSIVLTAAGGWPSTTLGCAANALVESATNKVNTYFLDFAYAAGAESYAEWTVAMPEAWDGGTLTAVFYWTANDATSHTVIWGIAGRAYSDIDTIDQAYPAGVEVTDTDTGTAYQVLISATTAAITVSGTIAPAGGQLVQFRVYRLRGGTMNAAAARLMAVKLKYTITGESD
jgi:hypothetical protein